MVEQACRDNAPDESLARKLARAIGIFGAKGPASNHIPSRWLDSLKDEARQILNAGEEGFRIDMALSHSGSARLRWFAALHFGLRRDERSLRELTRMLEDRSARVRRQALRWYASRIHCDRPKAPFAATAPTSTAPAGLGKLLECTADENFNVRRTAVMAVGAYRDADDARVMAALRRACDDPKHKVRHCACRILDVPCSCSGGNPQGLH